MKASTIGILAGIFVGLIIAAILIKAMNKDGKLKTEYDEMQERVRGKAYKYGFFTAMILEAIQAVLADSEIGLPITAFALHFSAILIAVLVQVTYCIWNDAYVGLNSNMTRFGVFAVVISLINFLVALGAATHGQMLVNGQLQDPFINLICGILFIIIGIEMFVKKITDKAGEEE